MTVFATDPEMICAGCEYRGKVDICPKHKVGCQYVLSKDKVKGSKGYDPGVVEKGRELE